MNVLVAYASVHGSTREIAERVGRQLAADGHTVTVAAVDEVGAVVEYDAVVVASAVHGMHWLVPAADFVRRNAAELRDRHVWLVSVGAIGDVGSCFGPRLTRIMRKHLRDATDVGVLRELIRPRGHLRAAGVVRPSQWGSTGRWFLRLAGGSFGDHRDWRGIEAWTDSVVRELRPATSTPRGKQAEAA